MRRAGLAVLAGLALAGGGAGSAVAAEDEHGHTQGFQNEDAPDFNRDARTGRVAPTAAQRAAADRLGTRVRWNAFGTPSTLIRHGGYLATGLGDDAPAAARAFLTANRDLFRLSPEAIADLELVNDAPLGKGHAVLLRQRFGDLKPTQDGLVAVGVVDGKITYVSSSLSGDAGAPAPATLTAVDAYRAAAADVGRNLAADAISAGGLNRGWFEFGVEGSAETQRARLVALPTPQGTRTAWETLILDNDEGPFAVTHFIDARTGDVLYRTSRVDYAQARWQVFPANPPLDPKDSTDNREIWCWEPAEGCQRVLKGAEPMGDKIGTIGTPERTGEWDTEQATATGPALPTETTQGNAATTTENWENFRTRTRPGQQAVSARREYTSTGARATWTNAWSRARCNPTTAFGPNNNNNDILAATVNLFAMHNRMHDWSYQLGFTEKSFNLQNNNFGRNSADNALDPEAGNAQAGAVAFGPPTFMGRDNANQTTPPDGIPGLTNMYLWQPIAGAFYSPCVDGDYDMSVIGHEYTHAISNRMVGGPDSGLTTREGGSMGESWSDLVAVEYLNEYSFVPTANENPFAVGPYVTGDRQAGIRNYGMNDSPLNYSNIGYDLTGAQVHADGEIWSAVNFDIRSALNRKYDRTFPSTDKGLQERCADGAVPADQCPGNRRWVQIMFDAFLLMQSDVSMVDARDAYLAADVTRFGAANQAELWGAFARRGLGEKAAEDPRNVRSSPPSDVSPKPSFESLTADDEGVLTFGTAPFAGGPAPGKAQLFIGAYEARTTPVADTDPETKDIGTDVVLVPGTYDFIVRSEGFGLQKFRRTVKAGERGALTVEMPVNLASKASGATITGNAGGRDSNDARRAALLNNLIDDTEETTWASFAGSEDDTAEDDEQERPRTVEGRNFTVDLAGGRQMVDRVQVSSILRSREPNDVGGDNATQNRFSALRKFEILACTADAANEQCAGRDAFRSIYTSPDDAFPSVRPRTRVPELTARFFDVPDTEATHVRLRVLTNQCTGAPDFQGNQNADPINNSDCSEGRPILIASQGDIVRAAEFQVFAPPPAERQAQPGAAQPGAERRRWRQLDAEPLLGAAEVRDPRLHGGRRQRAVRGQGRVPLHLHEPR
ncbi:MAG: M36 family metallopeptidase [Actinomycetota bacterium]|nr:M36 family metallopeptidase [Actinomycetota bacterium]